MLVVRQQDVRRLDAHLVDGLPPGLRRRLREELGQQPCLPVLRLRQVAQHGEASVPFRSQRVPHVVLLRADAVVRRDGVVRPEVRRPAARVRRDLGVGPDDGEGAVLFEGEDVAVVLHEDDGIAGDAAEGGGRLGRVDGFLRRVFGDVERVDGVDEAEDLADALVDGFVRDFAHAVGDQRLFAAYAGRARHLQVQPGVDRVGGGVGAEPVAFVERLASQPNNRYVS